MSSTTSATSVVWNLSDLFTGIDDPSLEATLEQATREAETFAETYRGTINVPEGLEAAHMRGGIERLEALYDMLYKPSVYAFLLFASDTSNPDYRDLQQRMEQRFTVINNKLLFFNLEWLEVSDEDAQRLMDDPQLATYRHYLQGARKYKPHTLSESEEKMINEKDITGKHAWQRFFTELTASLTFLFEHNGVQEQQTLDQILVKMRHADRSVREQAHKALYSGLEQQIQPLSFVFNTLMQDHLTMDRLRAYPDPMAQRHLANEIEHETVETMMRVVEENHTVAQTYFKLKAQLLNLPTLEIYDQYAPIGASRVALSYDEAKAVILESFGTFDAGFRDIAQQFFDGNWIDAEVRPGKRGGAFCSGFSPSHHPFILCNYTDDLRDAMTVAHELGHGIHFSLSRKQTLFNYYSTLPLAETASVFAEMLVFEHLLNQQDDRATKLALVCGKIEDIFATIYRQTVLTRFEQLVYKARGESRLTPEQLNGFWLEANEHYYGDAVVRTAGYEMGWSYIPHFIHTPFYCYSYVFGELLVLALYGMYREQGEAFVPRYRQLLESGGSKTPDELLAELGIDTRDPSFWQLGFDEVRRLVEWVAELAETG